MDLGKKPFDVVKSWDPVRKVQMLGTGVPDVPAARPGRLPPHGQQSGRVHVLERRETAWKVPSERSQQRWMVRSQRSGFGRRRHLCSFAKRV
jgi:hypothetical protein